MRAQTSVASRELLLSKMHCPGSACNPQDQTCVYQGSGPLGVLHLCAHPKSTWASCALLSTVPCCAGLTLAMKTLGMLMLATQAYIQMRYCWKLPVLYSQLPCR